MDAWTSHVGARCDAVSGDVAGRPRLAEGERLADAAAADRAPAATPFRTCLVARFAVLTDGNAEAGVGRPEGFAELTVGAGGGRALVTHISRAHAFGAVTADARQPVAAAATVSGAWLANPDRSCGRAAAAIAAEHRWSAVEMLPAAPALRRRAGGA